MSSLPSISAISFDLDDTLWPSAHLIARAEAAGHAWFETHAPRALPHLHPNRRAMLRSRAIHSVAEDDPRRSDLRYLRERLYFLALADAGYDTALAAGAFAVFDEARQQVEPFEDAVKTLERLSACYVLLAITNGTADLARIGWSKYFKLLVSPTESGAAKPDPQIYHFACSSLGLSPGCVLHVGDDPKLDVDAARQAGLQVAWINRLGVPWPGPGAEPTTFRDLEGLSTWLDRKP